VYKEVSLIIKKKQSAKIWFPLVETEEGKTEIPTNEPGVANETL
jgi:hypothetical protein